ncbi:MAG: aspartate aminotransferase family protein [Burkholderiaceae bacterium]|jgi:adenosylmethionine-8-amino-7-oxononanoate aminotransferase|nr:aspartate aminotransferase family protein [Burkholderiaceae bacterium]MDP4969555.1 aspartate aminotransferase family protein [Burkholderiaceae bacterium]MDP5112211.1 aspartate aminotransferase family protein [Burkholderiaceae bacterium]
MTHIIHRSLRHTPLVAASSRGIHIIDAQHKHYIDASGGAAVSCLGHAHPDVLAAMHAQIDKLAYAHTGFFTSEVTEALADHLIEHAPGDLSEVYFVSGGSEAVEAALKLARQYFLEIGQPERTVFVSRRQSYHGNTLGALAVGGNEWRRQPFAPLLMDVPRVAPCFEYRDRLAHESQDDYTRRLLSEIEQTFIATGPERIIAFCAETVVGATTGAVPPTPGYLKGVRQLCDKYGILYIADEVMCGMGRTGTLYAFEQDDAIPDIVIIAKGLGGGYQPIGAFLARSHVIEALRQKSGMFQHGHTYLGHPIASAAALAVQQVMQRDQLLPQVRARGAYLAESLRAALGDHPHVGDIRGRGLFMAVELVKDRVTKTPFDHSKKLHAVIKQHAIKNGLLVYPMGGTIDGKSGDHVLLAPPFIVTNNEIDQIVDLLKQSIGESLSAIA